MESIPGFISVPRPTGVPRVAGTFFWATVVSAAGPGTWIVRLDGQLHRVQTSHDLAVGQTLRLKLMAQTSTRWEFQLAVPRSGVASPGLAQAPEALLAAFVSRGLPLAAERLAAWTRWLAAGPSDKENWAASLDARQQGPFSPLTKELEPWLLWQRALEEGLAEPPPEDETVWDHWNLRSTPGQAPWLVVPLRWEYQGRVDAGFLQAHWNPQRRTIDQWCVTAAPAGIPFRLEAKIQKDNLELVWKFFRDEDRERLEQWAHSEPTPLGDGELRVTLTITGSEKQADRPIPTGVDLEA